MNDNEKMKEALKLAFSMGRTGAKKLGQQSKEQMDRRALRKKQDKLLQKLGKETELLMLSGELEHPGLQRAFQHLQEIKKEIENFGKQTE